MQVGLLWPLGKREGPANERCWYDTSFAQVRYYLGMDENDGRYVVGWMLSGETEILAKTPEEAMKKLKRQVRFIYKSQPDTKLSVVNTAFAFPANDSKLP